MPLDATRTVTITDAVNDAFDGIDRMVGAMLPKGTTEPDRTSVRHYASSLVARKAEAWRDQTKRAAVAGGVLPDHSADPYPVGTAETVFTGKYVVIGLKVVEQADRVDVAGLVADLAKAGVKPAVLKRLVKRHTRSFPGAHIYSASLV